MPTHARLRNDGDTIASLTSPLLFLQKSSPPNHISMIHRVSTRLSRQHLVIPRRSFFGINIGDITSDRPPPKPLLNKWEPEEWTVTTDRKIGGKSKAACEAGEEGGIVFKGNTSLDLRQESRCAEGREGWSDSFAHRRTLVVLLRRLV